MTLTVPWPTLAGMSSEPGTLCWLGPVTPMVSRQIAETGASDPRTEWRVIVTSSSGEFIFVTRIRRQGRSRAGPQKAMAGRARSSGRVTGLIDRVTVTVPVDLLDPGSQVAPRALGEDSARQARKDGTERAENTPGRLTAMLKAALITARRAHARAATAPTHRTDGPGDCSHMDHEPQYRPSTRLRATIIARDQTCRFPGCRQPAWHSDQDHSIPYHRGGPTCSCNLGPACRSHHRVKQERGWRLEQPVPGFFTWITPSGRRYDVAPDAYPT
jgi:hypothetical protein